jgi:hypothetical protein
LVYYRFLGRVMGKALFDRQLVAGHMVKHIYKHILGWPIQFKDLESVDEEYYTNLKQLQQLSDAGEDLEMLCLDFTTTQEVMGVKQEVELVKGGADIPVSNDNFPEYLEACLKYKLMDRVKPQLNELLLGFFDVIPEPLLTIFDFQELELLMCGLPDIDMDDWKEHTEYSGEYDEIRGDHPTCQWFWEVVADFDHEMKARLLQFVTGTSGVPARGFGVLQGNDGNVRLFTIHGVAVGICLYPRAQYVLSFFMDGWLACSYSLDYIDVLCGNGSNLTLHGSPTPFRLHFHVILSPFYSTCFNRIDLPLYESKEELQEKLKLAVTMQATGFDIE